MGPGLCDDGRFMRAAAASFVLMLSIVVTACDPQAKPPAPPPHPPQEVDLEQLGAQLERALARRELHEVQRLMAGALAALGDAAGKPEQPEKYRPHAPDAEPISPDEAKTAFTPYLERLEREAWWKDRPGPTELAFPLRRFAGAITGLLAALRAGCEHPERLLATAKSAGEYLLWTQQQGGRGVFPFPDLRGREGSLAEMVERFFTEAERGNALDDVVSNGWIVDDRGGGDLQFDNGLCGVAMLELYDATKDDRYLESAKAAAEWARDRGVVPNWNYNSFSVSLLARLNRTTGDPGHLAAAKGKTILGIFPGQITKGPNAGHWADPHNARLVYHYVLLRGVTDLLAAMPPSDPLVPQARECLQRGLAVRNAEIVASGIAHPSTTLEVLCRIEGLPPATLEALGDHDRAAALTALARYAAAGFRDGKFPVSPAAWGLYLETVRKP